MLRAYGWNDLAERAAPEFIEQEADEGKRPKPASMAVRFKERSSAASSPSTPTAPPRNAPAG